MHKCDNGKMLQNKMNAPDKARPTLKIIPMPGWTWTYQDTQYYGHYHGQSALQTVRQ